MMKKMFFGALGLLTLASCSNDELIEVNRDGDEITFNVVTNSTSRADKIYCNAIKPTQFYLSATYDGNKYINKDNITSTDNGSTWKNTNTRYWPTIGNVTFFAYHNADDNGFTWNASQPTVKFTVTETVKDQKDLIYAKKTQAKSDGGQVNLNFRHALSQIVFEAKNTNKNLYVEIYGVTVCNVKGGTATFTYPENDTDAPKMEDTDHDGDFSSNSTYSLGSWDLDKATVVKKYTTTFECVKLLGNSTTAKSLTNDIKSSSNTSAAEFNDNAMLLLPQKPEAPATTTAWNPSDDNSKPEDQTGSYFLVNCKIYNVTNGDGTEDTNVCLWGADATDNRGKDVAIPFNTNWEQGKKYIYTFVFGDGNGGYDPDEPNTPVLLPVTFDVTVDDFVNGGNTNVDMNTNE